MWIVAVVVLTVVLYAVWATKCSPSAEEQLKKLKGVRVVITGAGTGIGRELAKTYAKNGALKICLVGRRLEMLKETASECAPFMTDAKDILTISADCGTEAGCRDIVSKSAEAFGGFDVLVLNHVIADLHYIDTYTTEPGADTGNSFGAIERAYNTNVLSLIKMTMLSLPYFQEAVSKRSKSTPSDAKYPVGVVAVSSLASKLYTPKISIYSSCKAAVNSFFGVLRVEVGVRNLQGINVTTCCVGATATEAALNHMKGFARSSAASPAKVAETIVVSHIENKGEVWFGFDGKIAVILSFFFPTAFNQMLVKFNLVS